MTKKIRVENADNSTYKIRAYTEDLVNGQWVRTAEVKEMPYAADLAEIYIHGSRRVVIEEVTE